MCFLKDDVYAPFPPEKCCLDFVVCKNCFRIQLKTEKNPKKEQKTIKTRKNRQKSNEFAVKTPKASPTKRQLRFDEWVRLWYTLRIQKVELFEHMFEKGVKKR